MPFVTVQTVRGIMDRDQKQRLLERITDLMVEFEGGGDPSFAKMVWVKIDEQDAEHWSLGGLKLTTTQIEQRYGSLDSDGNRLARA